MENKIAETILRLTAIIDDLKQINYDLPLNATESYKYLNISRTHFYKNIRPKLKGIKKQGDKTTYFIKTELDKFT